MAEQVEAPETVFPCDSFKEAAPHLRRPFAPNAIRWRVVTGNMLVSYVDARTVIERLNLVVPHLWEASYELLGDRLDTNHVICHLTIDGLTRSDIGKTSSTDPQKGARSDALKRAGVHFGVGVSLYAMKRTFLPIGDGSLQGDGTPTLKKKKNSKGKDVNELTPACEKWLREKYGEWLGTDRGKHFGRFLDHGDEPDAIGDVEGGYETPADETDGLELAAKREEAEALYAEVTEGDTGKRRKLPPGRFKAELEGCVSEAEVIDLISKVKAL